MTPTYDRQRAIRYLKNAENAADASEAADNLRMAARRLRFEDDTSAQSIRRTIRYMTDETPVEDQRLVAYQSRRRLERGW